MQVFVMQPAWKACFWTLLGAGATAVCLGGAELLGLVERGALIGDASDAERWAAVAVGALLIPFGWRAFGRAQLTVDDETITYLGFGPLPVTRALGLAEITRWGHAVGRNQGRREPMLLFGLADGSTRAVKLAMYSRQADLKSLLRERLGPATAASATVTGVRFEEPAPPESS